MSGRPTDPLQLWRDLCAGTLPTTGSGPAVAVLTCADAATDVPSFFGADPRDLLVVSTAGPVVDDAVTSSIDRHLASRAGRDDSSDALDAPATSLVVVLCHDRCLTLAGVLAAHATGRRFSGPLARIAETLLPALLPGPRPFAAGVDAGVDAGTDTGADSGADARSARGGVGSSALDRHCRATAEHLVSSSPVLAEAVAEGRAAVVAVVAESGGGTRVVDVHVGGLARLAGAMS